MTMGDVSTTFSPGGWAFTREVVEVFDDHVRASVPHYDLFQQIVANCSDWLLPSGGLVADIGASTGTTVEMILSRHQDRDVRVALYDENRDMLSKASAKLDKLGRKATCYPATLPKDGLKHYGADLTLSLFTLQFMRIRDRLDILTQARRHSSDTGALLVAEKIRPLDSRWAEIARELTHDWKADHGIDSESIRAKQRALRGVLVPYPATTLTFLIEKAGWVDPEVIFRWNEWVLVGAFATRDGVES